MSFAIYTHKSGLDHVTSHAHPESPARLETVQDLLEQAPFDSLTHYYSQACDEDDLMLAHTRSYIHTVQDSVPENGYNALDGDTVLSPGSWDAATQAVGTVKAATRDVCCGDMKRVFCAIRPPGHHAMPDRAMGFCLFNNVFIGARLAQHHHDIQRVAIIDFDVHHGNGTDAMAQQAEDIFYISSHQWPFYPGTGGPDDQTPGKTLNAILQAGDGSETFRALYEDKLFPALESFAPDLVMISAGFDAHKDDLLGSLQLDEDDFYWITSRLRNIADAHAHGRIVSVLEGGYNLEALKYSVQAHIQALMD